MTSSARSIFATPSVQGNSEGQIYFPSVLTEGRHHCGKCEKQFSTPDEVLEHMDTNHENTMTVKSKQNDKPGNADQNNDESIRGWDSADTDDEQELVEVMEDHEVMEEHTR